MIVEVSAPSNIALIKYMGKSEVSLNRPSNSSLSWTMNHLRTFVTLKLDPSLTVADEWTPLQIPGSFALELSDKGKARFLKHLQFLKAQFFLQNCFFQISSANNFPSDCGLASSASSFAALTLAAYEISQKLNTCPVFSKEQLAELSRQGSGSSCRSLFSEWSIWKPEGAIEAQFQCGPLWHTAVIVESGKKQVSSSEAHLRVCSSLLFSGRPERAETRLQLLSELLNQKQNAQSWKDAFEICWAEFWDMHALFETSRPSFGYMTDGSLLILEMVRDFWRQQNDGPLVTMDAGANIHFLWREDQLEMASSLLGQLELLKAHRAGLKIISSRTL